MKKLTSLIFAVVSTMFLAAGATQAAEKFDLIKSAVSGPMRDGPTPPPPPCIVLDDPKE